MTLTELCQRLHIKPTLARALLAEGLIPGHKRNRAWYVEENDLPRVEQAFLILRGGPSAQSPVLSDSDKERCPNCQQTRFGPSQGRGWGEFFECSQCRFSIHEHNLSSPGLVSKAVQDHRSRPQRSL